MAAKIDDDDRVISDINITPFVDVVLVLLIILMVTSAEIVKASLTVELPKAASGGEAVNSTLNLVITKDSVLYLDGQVATEPELIAKVRAEASKNPGLQAVVAADTGVPYGTVVHLIDVVKSNGVKSFALNIERVPSPEPAVTSPSPAATPGTSQDPSPGSKATGSRMESGSRSGSGSGFSSRSRSETEG